MSGFVAVLSLDGAAVDRQILGRMTDALAFRGPDAQRIWIDGQVGLGHTLLATVDDFPEPAQPCSVDGRTWIVADARIDGRADLVARLSAKANVALAKASDPELILHAYAAWGGACVDHLIGDFAFVIWDGAHRRLFGVRDHFGVKPLYYAQIAGWVLVSNTIDSLRLHPQVSGKLNESAVGDFLLFGELVEPTTTVFADIQRVPAAHSFSCGAGGVSIDRYWSLPVETPLRLRKQSDYVEQFGELLRTAVIERLRTDKAAILMSGGLDSASIASVANELVPKSSLRAHTLVYDELVQDDERYYAGLVAKGLGIEIKYLVADSYALFEDYESVFTPEPIFEPLQAIFRDQCTNMSVGSRVALTGYGGDPGLLPWPGRVLDNLSWAAIQGVAATLAVSLGRYGRMPRVGLRTAIRRRLNRRAALPARPSWLRPDFAAKLDTQERWSQQRRQMVPKHRFRQTAYESLTNPFWAFLFESHDAGSSRSLMEFRHPFFDVRLVRFMLSLPSLPWCVDKHILRESMRGRLPEDVRVRPKTPFRNSPLPVLIRKLPRFAENLRPAPALQRFVDVDEARRRYETIDDSTSAWLNLRPYSFNYWLWQDAPPVTSAGKWTAPSFDISDVESKNCEEVT